MFGEDKYSWEKVVNVGGEGINLRFELVEELPMAKGKYKLVRITYITNPTKLEPIDEVEPSIEPQQVVEQIDPSIEVRKRRRDLVEMTPLNAD